jgi:NADPH:quinone reductase-like Zn-dependent oxidoreductase
MMPFEYPAVLGSPVAGTVEALGAGVTKVAVGQRVVSGTKVFAHKKPRYGGLQRFTIVDESEILDVSTRFTTSKPMY